MIVGHSFFLINCSLGFSYIFTFKIKSIIFYNHHKVGLRTFFDLTEFLEIMPKNMKKCLRVNWSYNGDGLSLHWETLHFISGPILSQLGMNIHLCPKSLIIKKKCWKKNVGTYFRTVQNWVNFVNLVILLTAKASDPKFIFKIF